jgi:hypothetical protein
MNDLDKAKSRDIVDVLSEYGHSFAKETGNYFMYYSMLPGREGEAHPSFMVKKTTGKWKDPGYKDMPKGGDVIDLVRIFDNCNTSDAIKKLCKKDYKKAKLIDPKDIKPAIEVLTVRPLMSKDLLDYVVKYRKIDYDIAVSELKEVDVRFPNSLKDPKRICVMVGFKNDLGGYELRSQSLKVSSPPKHITTVKGAKNGLNVFEGFMDYLSALTQYKTPRLTNETVVLNSIGNMYLVDGKMRCIPTNLFIDNDESADCAIHDLQLKGFPYRDMRYLYKGYNDWNQKLMECSNVKGSQ